MGRHDEKREEAWSINTIPVIVLLLKIPPFLPSPLLPPPNVSSNSFYLTIFSPKSLSWQLFIPEYSAPYLPNNTPWKPSNSRKERTWPNIYYFLKLHDFSASLMTFWAWLMLFEWLGLAILGNACRMPLRGETQENQEIIIQWWGRPATASKATGPYTFIKKGGKGTSESLLWNL